MAPAALRRLAAGALALALLGACANGDQVRWGTYGEQLQARIDAARATHDCAALRSILDDAIATSRSHEGATGVPNDALEAYVRDALRAAACPGGGEG